MRRLYLTRPARGRVTRFIDEQSRLDYSYPHVGATAGPMPGRQYTTDHVRLALGRGEEAFAAAVAAFHQWQPFDVGWVSVPDPVPIEPGRTVAVLSHVLGVWSLNACRILSVVDQREPPRRFGFSYGTLPGHAEAGEERFLVEWDAESDVVSYDIVAFFRPRHWLVRAAWPYLRHTVNRFRRESAETLRAQVARQLAN